MKWRKISAVLLSGAMVFSLAACGEESSTTTTASSKKSTTESKLEDTLDEKIEYKSGTGDASKEETVYVIADEQGSATETIVSEWLKNMDRTEKLEDKSSLTDIKNVKGDEEVEQSGENLTWDAKGADIYYEGNTDKTAPVGVKLTYYLDGKEVSAKDIAGKDGKVKIHVQYSNNSKTGNVYTPFMMATGMILDSKHFSKIEVSKGKVLTDGNNNIVVGIGFPGLKKSLNVKVGSEEVDLDIPESFDVTAEAKDFKLDMTMTIATNDLFEDIDTGDLDTDKIFGKIDGKLDQFTDGVSKLKDGIKKYTGGVSKLGAGTKKMADGTTTLKTSVGTLTKAMNTAASGSKKIKGAYEGEKGAKAGAKQLADGLAQLNTAVQALNLPTAAVPTLSQAEQAAIAKLAETQAGAVWTTYESAVLAAAPQLAAAKQAIDGSLGAGTFDTIFKTAFVTGYKVGYGKGMSDGAKQAVDTINTTVSGMSGQITLLKQKVKEAAAGASKLSGGVGELYKATSTLSSGLVTLNGKMPTLTAAISQINAGALQLNTGVQKLQKASKELNSGATKLNDGSKTLVNKVTDIKSEASKLTDRLTEVVDAGKAYKSFAGMKDGKNGKVKFIFKTAGINVEK